MGVEEHSANITSQLRASLQDAIHVDTGEINVLGDIDCIKSTERIMTWRASINAKTYTLALYLQLVEV